MAVTGALPSAYTWVVLMGRMRPTLALAAVAVLALFALVPLAQHASADHVYTHRYVVQGRVVDTAGQPVQGATMTVEFRGWFPDDGEIAGTCREDNSQRTGDTTFLTATSSAPRAASS